jgi:hypothetical protein
MVAAGACDDNWPSRATAHRTERTGQADVIRLLAEKSV